MPVDSEAAQWSKSESDALDRAVYSKATLLDAEERNAHAFRVMMEQSRRGAEELARARELAEQEVAALRDQLAAAVPASQTQGGQPGQLAALQAQLDQIETQVARMENLTKRLSDGFLDLDLLDQQARDVLGMIRSDEIVIR